jgi:hypothetical protein
VIEDYHIQACCADCEFRYDLTRGADCPRCRGTKVAWARRITDEEYVREQLFDKVRSTMRQRLDEWAKEEQNHSPRLTEGERMDVEELDKIFALEDNRDATRLPKP